MNPRELLAAFDRYLAVQGLRFEAVVIGGTALNLLGVVSRPTKDCDILCPKIPEEIAVASRAFAAKVRTVEAPAWLCTCVVQAGKIFSALNYLPSAIAALILMTALRSSQVSPNLMLC